MPVLDCWLSNPLRSCWEMDVGGKLVADKYPAVNARPRHWIKNQRSVHCAFFQPDFSLHWN